MGWEFNISLPLSLNGFKFFKKRGGGGVERSVMTSEKYLESGFKILQGSKHTNGINKFGFSSSAFLILILNAYLYPYYLVCNPDSLSAATVY